MALGVLVLLGWAFDVSALKNVLPGLPVMKANTAVAFIVLGAGILLVYRRWGILCALFVGLLALASMAESFFGWNLGIDQLLFKDNDPLLNSSPPGRMAFTTSLCLLLAAAALWMLNTRPDSLFRKPFFFGWIGSLLFGIAVFSAAATWSGFTRGFAWEYWTGMAVHTAGMLMFLGLVLLWCAWSQSARQWQATWLTASFIGSLMLLALIAASANANNRELLRASGEITQLHKALEALRGLESAMDQKERSFYMFLLHRGTAGEVMLRAQEVRHRFEGLKVAMGKRASDKELADFKASLDEFDLLQLSSDTPAADAIARIDRFAQAEHTFIARIRNEQEVFLYDYTTKAQAFGRRTLLLVPVSSFFSMMLLASAFFLLSSEIARRHEAMEELRWGEERFRTLANSIPHLAWISDPTGNVAWYNRRWYEYTGATEEQMREHGWPWVIDPQALASVNKRWLHSTRTGVPYEKEVPIRRHDGVFRRFLTRALPLRSHTGEILQWFGTCTDMEDYRQAMAALQRKEFELSLSQQLGHIGTFDWDIPKNHVCWSPELEALYGLPPNGFGGRYEDWRKAVHPNDAEEAERRVLEATHTGTLLAEWRALWPDGTVRWLGARASVTKDEEGRPLHMIGANFDITELKQAEEQMRSFYLELEQRVDQRTDQLKTANEELESFTYSVSHDLRAPLRAIDGFSRMLLAEHSSQLDSEGSRMLGIIRTESQRMGQLIDDLLTFSRLGKQTINSQPVDMESLAREVVSEVLSRQSNRDIQCDIQGLPAVQGQSNMLRQVWLNLIDNAVKFTQKAKPSLISIGGRKEATQCVYFIKDNGVGFDMRFANKLFGVFQRLHSDSEFSGTGVGLALVKRIVQRHGGKVWATGEPGQGATFYFALPCQQESES